MPLQFKPKTEEEAMASQLCPKGKQPFTILECLPVESQSKNNPGKPMIKLKVNVHAGNGFDYHIYDYVADWFMEHKFRHFFFSIGRGADYESGKCEPESYKGLDGWCEVGMQKAKGNFGPKAIITDYLSANISAQQQAKATVPATPASEAPSEADDVPF